jgi:hypothetical protein
MKRRCVVIVPTDEELQARRKKQEEEGEKNIPDEAVNEMKGTAGTSVVDPNSFFSDSDPQNFFFGYGFGSLD